MSSPMQNLFYMKRLSLRHQRYCFHKGFFPFFFSSFLLFFSYKASGERNSVILSYHAKRKFRITVCSIRMAPPPKALIIFWSTYPPVKNLQEGLRVGTPGSSLLWISCATPPSLLHADKKSFPRCYSNPFMLGTALSRRQSDANKEWGAGWS